VQDTGQPQRAESLRLAEAVEVLRRGGAVGYPSETVWGLAARPDDEVAVDRLYQLKGREASKPVQLSCLNLAEAQRWLRPGQPEVTALARFWPGPLTLLAWAVPACPEWLAPGGVVGIRVPDHPVIQALLAASGGTLATTSLNPSGLPAATSEGMARDYGLADLLLPDEDERRLAASPGLASTVFDLRTRQVVRAGELSERTLLQALEEAAACAPQGQP